MAKNSLNCLVIPDSVTVLLAGPLAGKSTLLEVIRSATTFVNGVMCIDSSDIIDWHLNPRNESPLRLAFTVQEGDRHSGKLVTDELICQGIAFCLQTMEKSKRCDGRIRHLLLSGAPRTIPQRDLLLQMFPNMRMGCIENTLEQMERNRVRRVEQDRLKGKKREDDQPEVFAQRVCSYLAKTLPTMLDTEKLWSNQDGRFTWMDFSNHLSKKALTVTKLMAVNEDERRSMNRQITDSKYSAFQLIEQIENPIVRPHDAVDHNVQTERASLQLTSP